MNDLHPLHYFLGMKVNYFDGGFFLMQSKCAKELLGLISGCLGPIGGRVVSRVILIHVKSAAKLVNLPLIASTDWISHSRLHSPQKTS